jgi:hypothetical protein
MLVLISSNRYERPIAHSRRGAHPCVMECRQERSAIENELSRVVNALPGLRWTALLRGGGTPELCKECDDVATTSLIENRIDR